MGIMNTQQYIALIENSIVFGSDSLNKLSEILHEMYGDIELDDNDKLKLEETINTMREKLRPNVGTSTEIDNKTQISNQVKRKRFPDYNFQLNIDKLDGIAELNKDNLPYPIWYRDIYLPRFHPMPQPDIQYPLVTVLSLINSKAVLNDYTKLCHPYFLGSRGSGKSNLADQFKQHYDPAYSIEIRPNWTGTSIRDELDSRFGDGEPAIAIFDNFNPDQSLARLASHYDLILANDKKSSISRISAKTSDVVKSEYITYCYKVFTSVFDLDSCTAIEAREIGRRCITLLFQTSEPEDSKEAYSWEGMQHEYNKIWGYNALPSLNNIYCKTLHELNSIKPSKLPIKGSNWELCKVPIAVGVYTGIFKDIQHGISHFKDYFDWFPTAKSSSVKDSLALAVQEYITIEHPRKVAEDKYMSQYVAPKYSADKIDMADIKKYIEEITGHSVQKRDQTVISTILGDYNFTMRIIGKGISYIRSNS